MSILKLIKQTLKTTILLTSITFFSMFLGQPVSASNINITDLNTNANAERINAGLAPLNLNSQLNTASLNKANHMFANNYWAHIAPDGMTPWTFIDASGYVYSRAGENLAMHYTSSSGVVAGWMASPSHKANVLHADYSDVGYAVVSGTLLGEQTTLVVAMYGSPRSIPVAVESIATIDSSGNDLVVTEHIQNNTDTALIQITDTSKDESLISVSNDTVNNGVKVSVLIEASEPKTVNESLSVGKVKNSGAVAGVMSIIPDGINNYRLLDFEVKIVILTISLLLFVLAIKFILFNLRDNCGNKYVWFRKRPVAGSTILGLVFVVTLINSVGFVL